MRKRNESRGRGPQEVEGAGERNPRRSPPREEKFSRVGAAEAGAPRGGERRYVWGVNPVLEVLRARPEEVDRLILADGQVPSKAAGEILSRAQKARIRVDRLPRERLSALSDGGVHQGVVAEVLGYQYAELEDLLELAQEASQPALLVVLDGVVDPHNFGAIIRSAHALGAHGVVVAKDRAAPVSGVVAKASAGALEYCKVARVVNISRALEQLKEAGLWVAALDVDGQQKPSDARLDGALALVVGSEGEGIREGVLRHCDFHLRIPMAGKVGSLNASASAAILLYEVSRQRNQNGKSA